jgi:pyrroloquinoline quinone biosynthesis protein D
VSETDAALPDDRAKPRLPKGVRLRHDEARGEWLLLAPESVLRADPVAVEILKRCDGERTIRAIVDDLAATFVAERALIDRDVRSLLGELAAKRVLDL